MQQYKYNDGKQPGGRRPRLYLARGTEVVRFDGQAIPGFCAISKERYEPNGKWSNTTYELLLSPGVRPLYFLSPLHGIWGEEFATWGQVAAALALPVDVAREIVRAEYPKTAARLDEVERFFSAEEKEGHDVETVIVSFGAPTRREMNDGYWDKPKSATTSDGRQVTVAPGPGWWADPVVIEPEGARIISSRHTPGMHGGYWAVEVAVPLPCPSPPSQ
jgi:hypothetical protein